MSDQDQGNAHGLGNHQGASETTTTKPTKPFRFKEKATDPSSSKHRSPTRSVSPSSEKHYHHRHRRRRHHHGRHRVRKFSPRRSPVPDADTAFRQSLFDALADDEGAAFWQGVYGQPIHNYPDTKVGPDGKLEQMTEEEYTAYVRRRMWEKSQEGHEEIRQAKAKERREQQRVKEQEQHDRRKRNKRTADSSNSKYDRDIFDFDHRHATRSNEKAWNIRWRDYLQAWQNLDTVASKTNTSVSPNDVPTKPPPSLKTLLSWPNLSNSASDINASELKSFFQHCPPSSTLTSTSSSAPSILLATLKQERIRWHPDKIQHRYGRLGIEIDTKTLARVTAVFQIVDELWIREKEKENEAHGLKDS